MRNRCLRIGLGALLVSLVGCGPGKASAPLPAANPGLPVAGAAEPAGNHSDPAKVKSADVSALFIGNSHTLFHDIPDLVARMIRFRHPGKKVYTYTIGVSFLEEVARDPRAREEIDSRPWKFVILQAQKISMSGRYDYSKKEGIDFAQAAKARGATVFFYSEWGLKGVKGDGVRQEKIYQGMADAAGVRVARVGYAWDLALAKKPDLVLHASDGNHQSALGAFLTAALFYGLLTGESPATLAAFPYPGTDEDVRKLLATVAAGSLASKK